MTRYRIILKLCNCAGETVQGIHEAELNTESDARAAALAMLAGADSRDRAGVHRVELCHGSDLADTPIYSARTQGGALLSPIGGAR